MIYTAILQLLQTYFLIFSGYFLVCNAFLTSESSFQDLVMLCYVSEPELVSKQYGCEKICLNYLILLDIDNILLNIVRYLLILSDID